jgi:hypothetical protein
MCDVIGVVSLEFLNNTPDCSGPAGTAADPTGTTADCSGPIGAAADSTRTAVDP